jgi:hypothetical protein
MPPERRLWGMAWGLLGILVLENLLGIFATLYVTLPGSGGIEAIFRSYPVLALHVVLGFLMVGNAAFLLLVAHRNGLYRIRNLAGWEVGFLALAIQEGFAFSATLDNAFSFGMEAAFLLSVVVVVRILTLLARADDGSSTSGVPMAV